MSLEKKLSRKDFIKVAATTVAAAAVPGPADRAAGDTANKKAGTTAHLVSTIDVKDFGAETVRVGDLNGDGAPDLLFVQSIFETREITCLTAATIQGTVLWQTGKPSAANGRIYGDLPVQVYDWDNDGANEVLYVRQAKYAEPILSPTGTGGAVRERARRYDGHATMVVLDASTGKEKKTFPIPAPADDSFLFADLTGRGRRQDLVVKDRYWNMWGVSFEGKQLWHWKGSTGHYPAVADLDGDGKDEVFVGYALLDHDGKVLFNNFKDNPDNQAPIHSDANYVVRLSDGTWRLAFGNRGAHLLLVSGRELWHHPLPHTQHVIAGAFHGPSPVQFMCLDRGQVAPSPNVPATLYLYDLDGKELWRRVQPAGSCNTSCVGIDWSGAGVAREVLAYFRGPGQPVAIYDGAGNVVDTFEMQYAPDRTAADRKTDYYAMRADVWGDRRQEVILFGSRGACIYANARPLQVPALYNATHYLGM